MKNETKILIASIIGIGMGLVGIDLDHMTSLPIFHWMCSVVFFLMFGIGIFLRRFLFKDDEQ